MNSQVLLHYYNQIADAPDAIAQLRRFILDLAVRGKLVPQDPNEEPASVLLERIAEEKATKKISVKETKSKRTQQDNLPFDLPIGWEWTDLLTICSKTGSGSTPRGGKEVYQEVGILFLRSQNIYNSSLYLNDVVYIDSDTHQKMISTQVQPNDLLLNITGGSIGRCCKVPIDFPEANISQHVAIIRLVDPQMKDFIHLSILSPYFQENILLEQTGAGRGGLPKNKMDRILIPLPPLAEQQRIVERVDQLMALCDQLEAARAQREQTRSQFSAASLARLNQPADDPLQFQADAAFALQHIATLSTSAEQIKALRQTILNLAVRGKLVPQDPNEEPASVLLERIAEEKAAKGIKTKENKLAITEQDFPFDLPTGWEWRKLSQFSSIGTGSTPSSSEAAFYQDGTIPWITSSSTSKKYISEPEKKITEKAVEKYSLKIYPVGTLLIALYGQGKTRGQITELKIPATINQACAAITLPEQYPILRRYIRYVFEKNYDEIRELAAGGAQPNLNVGKIKDTFIPLPPLAEQQRIVARVDQLMEICDQLEQQLQLGATLQAQLLKSVLHAALAEPSSISNQQLLSQAINQ